MFQTNSIFFMKTLLVVSLFLLAACSENDKSTAEISAKAVHTNKTEQVQPKNTTNEKSVNAETAEFIAEEPSNATKPVVNETTTEEIASEETASKETTSEFDEIQQKLDALSEKLTQGNQNNAELRKEITALIEQVKENQQTLERQAQNIKPKAE